MSWNDAQQYIRHPTAKTGHSYSLPGEVQWEHAARASSATAYHTGDTLAPQLAMLDVRGGAVKVDTYLVDGLGLHDIHSNVWEWVQDCHDPQACGGRAPSDGAAHVPTGCDSLALRGGSWKDGPGLARAALRYLNHPEFRYYSVDFRVGRVLPIDQGLARAGRALYLVPNSWAPPDDPPTGDAMRRLSALGLAAAAVVVSHNGQVMFIERDPLREQHPRLANRRDDARRFVHEFNREGGQLCGLQRHSVVGLFLDDLHEWRAAYAVLLPLAQRGLPPLLRDEARAARLHTLACRRVAYRFAQTQRPSNPWASSSRNWC